jgi:hypothetical protein
MTLADTPSVFAMDLSPDSLLHAEIMRVESVRAVAHRIDCLIGFMRPPFGFLDILRYINGDRGQKKP